MRAVEQEEKRQNQRRGKIRGEEIGGKGWMKEEESKGKGMKRKQ